MPTGDDSSDRNVTEVCLNHSLLSESDSPAVSHKSSSTPIMRFMSSVFASSPIASPRVPTVTDDLPSSEQSLSQTVKATEEETNQESDLESSTDPKQDKLKTVQNSPPNASAADKNVASLKSPLLIAPRGMKVLKARSSSLSKSARTTSTESNQPPLRLESCVDFGEEREDDSSGGTTMAQSQHGGLGQDNEEEEIKLEEPEGDNEICIFGVTASSALNNQEDFDFVTADGNEDMSRLTSPSTTSISTHEVNELVGMLGKSGLLDSNEKLLPSTPSTSGDDMEYLDFDSFRDPAGPDTKPQRVAKVFPVPIDDKQVMEKTNDPTPVKATEPKALSPLAQSVQETYRQRKKPLIVSLVHRVFPAKRNQSKKCAEEGRKKKFKEEGQKNNKQQQKTEADLLVRPQLEAQRSDPAMSNGAFMSTLHPQEENDEENITTPAPPQAHDEPSDSDDGGRTSFLPSNLTAKASYNKNHGKPSSSRWNQFVRGAGPARMPLEDKGLPRPQQKLQHQHRDLSNVLAQHRQGSMEDELEIFEDCQVSV
eukprot:CAMPEP_0168743508 /NCGR_PEP_ID=MMETSP0724-20121128/13614_1 /TAXON_ID=265536 /ORGANISM="Amphiprora sp., Strain CCMP467" /LENGTH=537 /DNA_ID=CAMNT_0008791143 /DNA_START=111 /DNA_END=1724 /DNA_ORIENTATION=+